MTSCMVLEWPGRWRAGSVAALLALPLLPTLPLLWFALFSGDGFSTGGPTFQHALANSVIVALLVALGSFALGLPIGVLNALYDYRGRWVLLPLSLLPLLTPSFVWPLGWRWLLEHRGRSLLPFLSGYSGCLLMFLPAAVTLGSFHNHSEPGTAVRVTSGSGSLGRRRKDAVPIRLSPRRGPGCPRGHVGRDLDAFRSGSRICCRPVVGILGDSDQLPGFLRLRPRRAAMPRH